MFIQENAIEKFIRQNGVHRVQGDGDYNASCHNPVIYEHYDILHLNTQMGAYSGYICHYGLNTVDLMIKAYCVLNILLSEYITSKDKKITYLVR